MAGYNGSGTYVRPFSWANDKANGINITASRFDTDGVDVATALSSCLIKDGQQTATAIIPFALGISCAAGSATAPMVASIGDLTTGVYSSASGKVDITSTGVRVGGFTSSGLDNTIIGAGTAAAATFSTATVTTLNKVTVTAPASASTLTIANGKTLTASSTVTLAGGDASILAIAASKTLTVSNTMTLAGGDSTVMTFPNSTDTVVTLAASQTLTNKTLTTAVLGSSTATTQSANDNSTKIATTAYVDKGIAGTLSVGSLLTVNPIDNATHNTAHGLGAIPSLIKAHLICLTAELGYSIGDVVPLTVGQNATNTAFTVSADATNIYFAGAAAPELVNRNTNGSATVTQANWKMIVTPYKIN